MSTFSYVTRRTSRLALEVAALATLTTVASAAVGPYTYTPEPGTGDLWSAGTHWDIAPASATDARITFVGDNATVLADSLVNVNTVDIAGGFLLNILDLQGTGPATDGASITVNADTPETGLTLSSDLAAPVVNLNALAGEAGLTYQINPVLTLAGDATFTGEGTATFKFSGGISGEGRSLAKSGTSQMSIGGTTTLESLLVGFGSGPSGKLSAEAGSALTIGTGTGAIRIGSTNLLSGAGVADFSLADSFTANVTDFFVGVNYGGNSPTAEGTLHLSPSNTITATTTFAVGRSAGNFNTPLATATVPANSITTVNTPLMTIGQGKSNGSFTVGADSAFDLAGITGGRAEFRVGHNDQTGSGAWGGTADLGSGSFRGYLTSMSIGRKAANSSGNATGTVTFGSSDLNEFNLSAPGSPLVIGRFDAGSNGVASGTLTIGHLGFNSYITSTNNGAAILIGTSVGTAVASQRANGTLNLGPGSLTLDTSGPGIAGDLTTNPNNSSTVKFNGTTLIAAKSSIGFIQTLTSARISDGGLTIATNNNSNITVVQGLSHDPAGAATDGGLTKDYPGVLTLPSTNTYTGNTKINGGIIFFTKTAALPGFATPGRLTVAEGAGLGMNVGGAGEFTLTQLETYRTGGTFAATHHPLILDTANAGGELTYTSARGDMGTLVKRGNQKLILGHDVDIEGGLEIGINQHGNTLAIAAGKDFSMAPSDFSGFGSVVIGMTTTNGGTAVPSSGTLDASAADSFTMEVATLRLGHALGNGTSMGTLSLPADSSITAHTEIAIADGNNTFNNVNSTISTGAGGTAVIRTPRLYVGRGKARGFLTAGTGSTVDVAYLEGARTAMEVGNNTVGGGSGPWSGTANFGNGIFKGKLSSLLIGAMSSTSSDSVMAATMTLSTSPLNHLDIEDPATPLVIGRYTGNSTGTSTGTLTLGNLDADSSISNTGNGAAILIATGGNPGTAKATGTLNLNGGTLTITTTGTAILGDTANTANNSTVNFNGITLRAGAASTNWITGLKTASIGTGGLTLDTNGHDIAIAQELSGTGALTKNGTGTLTCYDANSYSGSTTVNAGMLALVDEMLSDTAAVTVAAGALLNLGYPSTMADTVQSLTLGGEPASIGIWGAEGSGAPNTSPLITGTGRLNVLTGPAGADPYENWASQIADPDERDREDDPDHDGFPNEVEYLFGTSPTAANGALVQATTVGTNLVVRWNQLEAGGVYQLQESTTLVNPWDASLIVPALAGDQDGVPENYDRMEAAVPIGAGRKFVRVSGVEED